MQKIFKLLTESSSDITLIKESVDASKPQTLKFQGTMLVSDQVNANSRTYPYELLKREVDKFRTEMINTSRALMELEHPSESVIDPQRACARLLSLEEDGDTKTWVGEAIILASDPKFNIKGTPCGDILASLAMYGTKFGTSSRALGEVDESTGTVTDLQLVTIDAVLNPSICTMVTSEGNRFVNGILESKQWVCNNHGEILEEKYNALEKNLSHMPNTHISTKKAEFLGKAVAEFFESLKH